MTDSFKIDFNIPWVVRLYTIWKPIYEKDGSDYILKYIEFLVFIHSVLDSNGNEISEKNIDYIEVVNKTNSFNYTLKLPEVFFEDDKGGKDIKKFRINNISVEDYDAEVWNLNNNLINKTSCEYKQYYNYANFVDDLYGINGEITYDEYFQKSKKRKTAYENSLLFKIHLKNLPIDVNYKYDKNTDKYKEYSSNSFKNNKKVVYAVASNPFFLPSALFDERSNDIQVYSFFNTDENNTTKAFICSHDVNAHSANGYKIDKPAEFNCFYKKDRDGSRTNYNYVYAIRSLYSSGNIKLELCSPFEWSENKFNIYSRYKNPPKEDYKDMDNVEFDDLYGNSKFPEGFNVMSEEAKQIVCYHNGVDDDNNLNKYYFLSYSDYDTSYVVDNKSILISKETFKKRFCIDESEYDSTKYIDCGQRKAEINFGTATWDYQKYNTLAELKYTQEIPPFDENNPKGVKEIYNNTWFFDGISDVHNPCVLFYGMYRVESIL